MGRPSGSIPPPSPHRMWAESRHRRSGRRPLRRCDPSDPFDRLERLGAIVGDRAR
jgi:hypothetical protein